MTATRDSDGTWIMVYTPTGKSFSLDTKTLSGCQIEASWYSPLDGTYTSFDFANGASSGTVRDFTPPTGAEHADWLLVLQATAKNKRGRKI